MPKRKRITDDELLSIINSEITAADGYAEGSLARHRKKALEYYLGMPYGDEEHDRSQVVTSEVSDAVEGMMPELIKIFCSTDDVVAYEPTEQEHEQFAENATEYARYIFNVDNRGFVNFYTLFKDALLFRNCATKIWWEEKRISTLERYAGLTEDELAMLFADDAYEILDQVQRTVDIPEVGQDGQVAIVPTTVYDVRCRRYRTEGRVRIEPLPAEELLIRPRLVSIETTPCIHHRVRKEVSDLVQQGYDLELLEELSGVDSDEMSTEKWSRFRPDGDTYLAGDPGRDRSIVITETYIAIDVDGDGENERLKCVTAGGRWLEKKGKIAREEWDGEWPIVGGTAIIMPHKWLGHSIADLTMDLQRMSSSLQRQIMDNIYAINTNRSMVIDGQVNLDDLLVNRQQQAVRVKRLDALAPIPVVPLVADLLPAVEMLEQIGEKRHGVTRYNQGLDADSLNKTKGGMSMIMTASQERIWLAARCLAETVVVPIFDRILKLICRHQREPRMVKLSKGWVSMDPRLWSDQMAVVTRVGLGTGNKEEQAMRLDAIANYQALALQAGGPVVTWKNIFNTMKKRTELAGLRDVENYWTDPDTVPPQPPPDPSQDPQLQAVALGAKAQVESARIRAEQQANETATKTQLDGQKAGIDAELELRKLQVQREIADEDRMSRERIAMAQIEKDLRKLEHDALMAAQPKDEDKPNGGPEKPNGGPEKPIDPHMDQMHSMMASMLEHLDIMAKHSASPKEIIRGVDGKIAGLKHDGGMLALVRGKDGRATHVQPVIDQQESK